MSMRTLKNLSRRSAVAAGAALLAATMAPSAMADHWPDKPLRLILEHTREGAVRLDQPIAPFALRRFGPRFVSSEVIDVPR